MSSSDTHFFIIFVTFANTAVTCNATVSQGIVGVLGNVIYCSVAKLTDFVAVKEF